MNGDPVTKRTVRRSVHYLALVGLLCGSHFSLLNAGEKGAKSQPPPDAEPIKILVMDPLALPLSCACVDGIGQKDYGLLAEFLGRLLKQPVRVTYAESLQAGIRRTGRNIDLIVGPQSIVRHDAQKTKFTLRPMLALTDRSGRQTVQGVILVRTDDPALTVKNLAGRTMALGPAENPECHAQVRKLFTKEQIAASVRFQTKQTIEETVYALVDQEADAAVVPQYLPPLLVGCNKILPNSVRILAPTEPIPFVQVFATANLNPTKEQQIRKHLLALSSVPEIRQALESRDGFTAINSPRNESAEGWTDWRGPGRAGQVPALPKTLDQLKCLWTASTTGPALAGIAATDRYVLVADKDAELTRDIFRCFDAQTGQPLWTLEYDAHRELDYTNAPRAMPVIHGPRVYCQGAWGDLHCVEIATGRILWKRNFIQDFGAQAPTWGYSVPPLLIDGKLIVAPGAQTASLAALDPMTGKVLWQTPGHAAAYAPFLFGEFRGKRQIVGYDVAGLAGWDLETGKRLWEVIPPGAVDFHVGTPVLVKGKILVGTENNATRLYEFDPSGKLGPKPMMHNDDCAPDTCTPVIRGDLVFCSAYGELYCLDLSQGLKTAWTVQDDRFFDHVNLVSSADRILAWTTSGDLILFDASAESYHERGALRPFAGKNIESMSHPAFVGNRIYLRCQNQLACYAWEPSESPHED